MKFISFGITIVVLIASAGCGGPPQLMATPNLYSKNGIDPFPNVPPELQNNHVEVLYVTDRGYDKGSTPEAPKYGHKRSRSVVFGVADVQLGKDDVTWEQLVKASTSEKRKVKLEMKLVKVTELTRFPPTPKSLVEIPATDPAAPPVVEPVTEMTTATTTQPAARPVVLEEEIHESLNQARAELSRRLAKSPVKDVYLFVHGVKTGFGGSIITAAEVWHFLGREGVAIAYSWPAGGKGLLRGYNYDYNSSEFTVYHLKETLKAIAGCKDVGKVHIIAHSRGTDVVNNALRELHLEIEGSGRVTRDVMKFGTVVLAAPDLDIDVVIQRAVTARLGQVPERTVLYICAADEALGFSHWLFGGTRLGKLQPNIFSKAELAALRTNKQVAIVDARVTKPGSFGHNYFYSNPAVSSDLVLVLRYGKAPGAESGRPLGIKEGGFWTIDDNYPRTLTPGPDAPSAMLDNE